MSDQQFFIRKSGSESEVIGPLPLERVLRLLHNKKLTSSDEFSHDQQTWRSLSDFRTRRPGQQPQEVKTRGGRCRFCGKNLLPNESACPTCLRDPKVQTAEENRKLKAGRKRIQAASSKRRERTKTTNASGTGKPSSRRASKSRKRPQEPFRIRFDSGLSMAARLIIFVVLEFLLVSIMMAIEIERGAVSTALIAGTVWTIVLSLACGVYLSITLIGEANGRCTVQRTRFICFIPNTKSIPTTEISQLRMKHTEGRTPQFQLIFGLLLCAGLLPGLIWWIVLLGKKDIYELSARIENQGILLYRGQDESKMRSICDTFEEKCGIGLFSW